MAVFVHAGAGYHSHSNEKVHLEACSDASRAAMRFLRAGASATQAVEVAIRCLEDREITNAGYGSNLNMDGVVECDATIVDHLGRSGACGAVPGIKNPISLARLILETSAQPLSLRRVPPNILVGLGAKEFAEEHGMAPVLNEHLVSKGAKYRYNRWLDDLKRVEVGTSEPEYRTTVPPIRPETDLRHLSPAEYEKAAFPNSSTPRRDHASAILTGTWNEGQPDSPYQSGTPLGENGSPPGATLPPTAALRYNNSSMESSPNSPNKPVDRSALGYMSAAFQSRTSQSAPKRPRVKSVSDDALRFPVFNTTQKDSSKSSAHDGMMSEGSGDDLSKTTDGTHGHESPGNKDREDSVSDTVGVIAIDHLGNIAGGSSSGGIGMKHRGRIGPAALLGIGTAVIPEDPNDPNGASVAAVTSGTGEHLATSFAASKCAERLYNETRRGRGGRSVEELDYHNVMEAFIVDDFMNHPGVKQQVSVGAIGVMAVKKDRTGIYFYFAHNTDSFALASYASNEKEPSCVMSRLGKVGPVVQGGRRIRID